jgi:hypothetical protein
MRKVLCTIAILAGLTLAVSVQAETARVPDASAPVKTEAAPATNAATPALDLAPSGCSATAIFAVPNSSEGAGVPAPLWASCGGLAQCRGNCSYCRLQGCFAECLNIQTCACDCVCN